MRKNRGAVPIIATMLLLTIVSATVIVVYSYVSGATVMPDTGQQVGRMLEKLKPVEVKAFADGQFRVYIMNTGTVDSVIDMFYVKNFTGGTLLALPANTVANDTTISAGETMECKFDPFLNNSNPWDWYEIVGVTDRGNKVTTNLYGYFTGAYELGIGPEEYENDTRYEAFKVTINNVTAAPPYLENLTGIDGITFGYPATNWNNTITTYPTGAYDFNITSGQYIVHNESVADLSNYGSSTVLHFNIHDVYYFMSSIFNGTTSNRGYPELMVTFIFDLQNSGWADLNGQFQFFDWSRNEYVTSGNGYYQFSGPTLPVASSPPAVSNYRNITFTVNASNLLGEHGEWSLLLNMTSSGADNVKLDYFSVSERVAYAYSFETVFWYKANNVTEANVTQILFSVTGIFPTDADYSFRVFDYDSSGWVEIGTFSGSSLSQTCVFLLEDSCSRYIDNSTKDIQAMIIPTRDLPLPGMIYIDQARIIIRQVVT